MKRSPSPRLASANRDAPAVDALVERVVLAGHLERADAARALRTTLRVLGERLTKDEAHALGTSLPDSLARVLEEARYDGDFDADAFYQRVARREKVRIGAAREEVDVVLRALGDVLERDLRTRLVRALPERLGERLNAPELGEPPPHVRREHSPPLSTLAVGRPGSRHPLSEAAPPGGHRHSVAENDDPHAETKLSSARGLTQERMKESLATGHGPSVEHPIADTNDEPPR